MPGKSRPPSPGPAPGKRKEDVTRQFEKAVRDLGRGTYVLRLFIAGTTPRSARAIANLKSICEEYLGGRYDLEVIDVYQQGAIAKGAQVVAAPTLVKKLPPPVRRLIGDMSDKERVLVGLDIRKKKER